MFYLILVLLVVCLNCNTLLQGPGKALEWASAVISRLDLPDNLEARVAAFKDSASVDSGGLFALVQLYSQKDSRARSWHRHGNRLCELALSD